LLQQLSLEHPDVAEEFPCYLSKGAGVDKKLMHSIIIDASKGTGPAATAKSLHRKHHHFHGSQEIKWGAHVRRRRYQHQSLIDSPGLPAESVKKFPDYLSDEMGGQIASASWLVFMFCKVITNERPHLDAECLKRMLTSKTLIIDGSFKVPKWVARWGGTKLFGCLMSAVNEHGETILQHFQTAAGDMRSIDLVVGR
jgi:hypothetical protein